MKIFENKVKYPPDLNPIAINFINDLLNLDPNKRLESGENGFNNIKSHEYFKEKFKYNNFKYIKINNYKIKILFNFIIFKSYRYNSF